MELTDGEKLILIMLSDLQHAQGIKQSVDPELIKAAIHYDCLWGLNWEYPGIPFKSEETPEIVTWVMDILQMWTVIEMSFTKLSDTEKLRVERDAHPFGANPRFGGFAAESEAKELKTLTFLVNHLHRFLNFKDRNFTSSIPLSGRYKRMYDIYQPMLPGLRNNHLSTDQPIEILLQDPSKNIKKDESSTTQAVPLSSYCCYQPIHYAKLRVLIMLSNSETQR